MKSTPLTPAIGVVVMNDGATIIPPRSIVLVSSVTKSAGTDIQEPQTLTHVKQYDGSAGNIMVTGAAIIRPGATGQAFYDDFIYVAIDQSVPKPTPGQVWGPVSGKWTIGPTGTGFVAHGFPSSGGDPSKAMFYRAPSAASSSSTATVGGCGCCECFDCITPSQAVIGSCAAAPNGAAYQYSFPWGISPFSDNGGTSGLTTLTYGSAVCTSSSSSSGSASSGSSSSSSGGSGGLCTWYSCPVSICAPNSSTSSSSGSSSSSTACGVYQLKLVLSLDGSGNTVESIYISFVSGTDWMGTGT